MIRDTIVIDLDGTLSDCRARQHLVMGKHRDYDSFNARTSEDELNEWCAHIIHRFAVSCAYEIVIVSARPASVEPETVRWLRSRGIAYARLCLLRRDGDGTPAAELKREWLRDYGAERVLFAIDDDPRNAAMFKGEGVTCLLAPGWTTEKPSGSES